MLLQELHVEGFRSLKSVTWKLGRLNVLIGPNGGGKSNLLRALDLIRAAAKGELRETILQMGGMAPLIWDGEAKVIRVQFTLCGPADSNSYKHQLALKRLGQSGSYEIGDEELSISSFVTGTQQTKVLQRPKPEDSLSPQWIQPDLKIGVGDLMRGLSTPLISTEAALSLRQWAGDVQRTTLGWSIYNDLRTDQDAEIRRATVTRFEKRVEPDGQNLIAVLHTLYTGDRQFEEFLDNAMAAAFPDDYEKLNFPPSEDGRVQMRVRRKHRKKADSAADLSDGTLRFLLLATILGSPDPAPLIAIDEPEAGLHPRMLPIIAELAENAALKTQVIFTTHSPEFLDAFRDEPPTTTVVTSDGSATKLTNIEGDELKRWLSEYSLGRFAFSGAAEANT